MLSFLLIYKCDVFYLFQVLGRFGLQASNLMVNPQLDGLKCPGLDSTKENASSSVSGLENILNKEPTSTTETENAVQNLFASCNDVNSWVSYQQRPDETDGKSARSRGKGKKRKVGNNSKSWTKSRETELEEAAFLKRMRGDDDDDEELQRELDKFQTMTEGPLEDDAWEEPDDLFGNDALL